MGVFPLHADVKRKKNAFVLILVYRIHEKLSEKVA